MIKNIKVENSNKVKKILVVGDWVVDEHWVTGIHRSPTSSRTGQLHRRALHSLNSTTQSFCGAGQVASILHQTEKDSKKIYDIFGIGIWHNADTKTLESMLDPKNAIGQTPHRLIRPPVKKTNKKYDKLFNLGDLLGKKLENSFGTTRVMRIYQHTGSEIDLMQRLDWELPAPTISNKPSWITDRDINNSALDAFLNNTFDAVVIKDLCKGVISEKLIKKLANYRNLTRIPWFVSSKEYGADWLKLIPENGLKLLLIPEVATRTCEGDLKNVITESGYVSKEAFDVIDKLAEKLRSSPLIVVLPNGLSLLAHDYKADSPKGWLQSKTEIHPLAVGMPMASVFFSALIANLLNDEEINTDLLLKEALDFTQNWMEIEVKRIIEPDSWTPKNKESILNLKPSGGKSYKVGEWEEFDWEGARKEWKDALSYQSKGIIEREEGTEKKYIFELKRAMTEINDYVCIVDSKRKTLRVLIHELENFKLKGMSHVACMLIASPGSGKTYLVKCLAKSLKMRYLSFNITQMLSKNDILDCFDTIVTTQARNREEPILVFFDEINATLGGQHVYDIFLAPLEEGIYVRAGKTFQLDPCFWLFAGTNSPLQQKENSNSDGSTKATDFESRFTIPPLDLKIVKGNNEQAKIEKIYLGVSLLRIIYTDVRWVSEQVLSLFYHIKPDVEVRVVKHFVKSFTNIQYGKVLEKNVPKNWFAKEVLETTFEEWRDEGEGRIVEIKG